MAAKMLFPMYNFNVQTRIAAMETVFHFKKICSKYLIAKVESELHFSNDKYQLRRKKYRKPSIFRNPSRKIGTFQIFKK
jgi:hypothetical protein